MPPGVAIPMQALAFVPPPTCAPRIVPLGPTIPPLSQALCYRLSMWQNYSRGICSGLETWRTRCTTDASSGMRHIVLNPPLLLIALVTVLLNGGVSPITPALSMTHASVPVPVPFPQLSPHVRSYCPITPNPCALGQQVTVLLSRLIVLSRLMYITPRS